MSNKWTIREATINDSEAIFRLHDDVYRELFNLGKRPGSLWQDDARSWWQWWMIDNPTGKSYSYVAEDKGHIIDHDAHVGLWLNLGGKKRLATYGWGRVTHPDYMRQGIARSLYDAMFKLELADGVVLLLGSASELGLVADKSYGAVPLGSSNTLMKILDLRDIILKKTGSSILTSIFEPPLSFTLKLMTLPKIIRRNIKPGKITEVRYFDKRFDNLWAKLKDVIGISFWKDSEYLNWRYINRPGVKYQVLAIEEEEEVYGFTVLRCVETKYYLGHILDLVSLPGKEAYVSYLIDEAVNRLREIGVDFAICHMLERHPYYHLLINNGFWHRGQYAMWTVNKRVEIDTPDVVDIGNWFLMRGDSDGV